MRETIGLLMKRALDGLDLFEMVRAAERVDGVLHLSHVRACALEESHTAVEARAAVDPALNRTAAIGVLARVRAVLADDFDVHYVALELASGDDEHPVVPDE